MLLGLPLQPGTTNSSCASSSVRTTISHHTLPQLCSCQQCGRASSSCARQCNQCTSVPAAVRLSASRRRRARQLRHVQYSRQPKVAAFARRWAGLVLTRRNDYVLKFD